MTVERKWSMVNLGLSRYLLPSNSGATMLMLCHQAQIADEQPPRSYWSGWEVFSIPMATFNKRMGEAEAGEVVTCSASGQSYIEEVEDFVSRRSLDRPPWRSQGRWPTRRAALEGVARLVES